MTLTAQQLPNRPYARLTTEELAELKAYYEKSVNDADPMSILSFPPIFFAQIRLREIAAELAHRQEAAI